MDITKEDFVIKAIKTLRDPSRSQGIHSRFSGFNDAFKKRFGVEARETTDKMAAEGKIVVQPRKGGVMLYLAGEAPKATNSGDEALAKILE